MKKLIAFILIFTMYNCGVEIKPNSVSASDLTYPRFGQKYILNGMTYRVFSTNSNQGGIYVVNVTKEELEVELLRLQIAKLKAK